MAENCGCEEILNNEIEYTKNPPYVSKRSFEDYLAGRCRVCNEVIDYNQEPSYADCCVDQIVVRELGEVLRVDDPDNLSYVGAGGLVTFLYHQSVNPKTLTANVNNITTFTTSGTTTVVTNNANITLTADALLINYAGFYFVEMTYETNSNAAATQANYHIYLNGGGTLGWQTYYYTGANPTESASARFGRVNMVSYLNVGQSLLGVIVPSIGWNTSGLRTNVKIVRLSTTR
jgi:hypothetical protein